ncbi:MAG: hypothetical protein LBL90_06155 [Prevotellaceae bacterium]|jgi:hypothetical protein|nr:hypothetical protein [Prevotellaceae bacterium]
MQQHFGCCKQKKEFSLRYVYVCKKQNKSGTTSVVIIDKSSGKIRYMKTIGVSSGEKVIAELCRQGKEWISLQLGDRDTFMECTLREE